MNLIEITVVYSEDWSGLYINGQLEYEGHSIFWLDLALALKRHGMNIKIVDPIADVDQTWLEDRGNLPQDIKDIKYGLRIDGN